VGSAIILFNIVVPPRVGLSLELAVAFALVVVGLLNINAHGRKRGARAADAPAKLPAWRAFIVGLVHGLAGSAAVALLVLATVRDARWACGYLLVFGLGTLIGMTLVTTAFASPLGMASRRWSRFGSGARLATGALSVVFGAWLIYQIGWRDGLFVGVPIWEPK
jgi:high-affinity nickel-transport protein